MNTTTTTTTTTTTSTTITRDTVSGFTLREEQWVAPVMALSCLNMIVIALFEIFVIYKACRTSPSRRHLFLGQMLLLGLFLSSALGIAFVPNPSWISCTVIRAGLGICYSVIFATLLVKTVFLLSLHSGIYLPALYQALLLFFIIATQLAIDSQWLLNHTSTTVIDYVDAFGTVVYKCDHNISSLLFSLVYDMFLIVLVSCLSLRVKGHRENHGEGMFIAITVVTSIVLWCVWIGGSLTSASHYRDAFLALGIVGQATLVFLVMFLPKGRQLAAMGREGMSHDDRDQLSSPSSPSIYTPSFLHIKPSHLIPLTKTGGNLYKQFGQTNNNNTSSYHTSNHNNNNNNSGNPNHHNNVINNNNNNNTGAVNGNLYTHHSTQKSMNNDRFFCIPPPGPPLPPPGHRVWRTGCYPTSYHIAAAPAPDDPYFYPYDPQSRQIHGNPNIKFFRAPLY
ncbi:metabotropic glutamate receptor-like protein R [Oppia nitens]|uniref:metabotropic glutamate receptor-like protein R n=1 Tax=Oppia nitens TaxID=1686743 RepID=UPI0023D9BD5F|nr:metabotropic glutamate receptor-like protein R [Oppia nitens]